MEDRYLNNLKIIEERFGLDHKINGLEVAFKCPFCSKRRGKADEDYKFSVNVKSLKGHCFKCHVKLRLKDTSLDVSTSSVFNSLLDMYSNEVYCSEDDDDDNMFYIPNVEILKGSTAYKYLINRGIDDDKIKFYNLKLGTGENLGRIIIPNTYENGWVDMYQGRTYIDQVPKYRNPYGVDKSKIVFNIQNIKENSDIIYICEGAITAICAGKEAVGVYGCHPSENQINQILAKNVKNIYCCLDNDEAGRPGNEELTRVLSQKAKDSNVYIVYMPEGKDAADIGETAFKEYVRKNAVPYYGKTFSKLF